MPRCTRRGGSPPSAAQGEPALVLVAVLGALVLLSIPFLGAEPWPFEPEHVEPSGPFAPLVRAAEGRWDVEVVRSFALVAAVVVAVAGAAGLARAMWPRMALVVLTAIVVGLLAVPAVLLQTGLRQSTAPWFHTNDSTYQIELGGELVRRGENPYGHDYRFSGLERFYSRDGVVRAATREEQVALRHFAYFPGTALSAAAWTLLPPPWGDYRFFVLLTSFGAIGAAMAFPVPFSARLAAGAVLAANPLAVRAAWFGTADAPSLLFTVLAFALVARSRHLSAAAALGVAVLLKQFALVAVPFIAAAIAMSASRAVLLRAASVFSAIAAGGLAPFLAWDAAAFWADTIEYGGSTYRIVGYGLSGLLLKAGVLESRTGPYPFLPLVGLLWLPLLAWLLGSQLRARSVAAGAGGFAAAMVTLLFLARVFQGSYLVWPLAALTVAALLGWRAAPRRSLASNRT